MGLNVYKSWKKDHIRIVRSTYFCWKVHLWTTRSTNIIESNPKTTSQNPISNLYPRKSIANLYPPNPIPNLHPRNPIPNLYPPNPIPNLYCRNHIPSAYPIKINHKPISHKTQSQTYIPYDPIPNLYPRKPNPKPRPFLWSAPVCYIGTLACWFESKNAYG